MAVTSLVMSTKVQSHTSLCVKNQTIAKSPTLIGREKAARGPVSSTKRTMANNVTMPNTIAYNAATL